MLTTLSARSLSTAFALGAYGGAVLALSDALLTPGKGIVVTYALVVLGLILAIRAERLTQFSERFVTTLLAFMLASLVLYVTVMIRADAAITFGHISRLAFLLMVGVAVSLPAAVLSRAPQHGQMVKGFL
jgi:uncharacterized membrane protein